MAIGTLVTQIFAVVQQQTLEVTLRGNTIDDLLRCVDRGGADVLRRQPTVRGKAEVL